MAFRLPLQKAQLQQPVHQHLHGGVMDLGGTAPRLHGGDGVALGGEHQFVEIPLLAG